MKHLPIIVAASALLALSIFPACGDDPVESSDTADTFDTTDTSDTDKDSGPTDTNTGNSAPELERIGDRVAPVGQALIVTLNAVDADGDDLSYSVFGARPEGSRFDKAARRFEWTPTTVGQTIFLTFVVSDGSASDRETVRIEVVPAGQTSPPKFVAVGDQQVRADMDFTLKLEATDPDGDKLTFGNDGALPDGATLDPQTGRFAWRPSAALAGAPVRVSFTVSDGALTDTMNVRFVVVTGTGNDPAPPVPDPIGTVGVAVGATVNLTLTATDPNGDAVSFALVSGAPATATIVGNTFSYTGQAGDVGRTFDIAISVSDGTFTALTSMTLTVSSGQVGNCTADPEEPNDTFTNAKPLAVGTIMKSICETADQSDLDLYEVQVTAGSAITATLTFDGDAGDLDLFLIRGDDTDVTSSEGITSTEMLSYTAATDETLYLLVVGYGLEPLAMTYTLTTSVGAPLVCSDDGFEPNDTPGEAKPLPASDVTLQICTDDLDYFTFPVACGERVEIGMLITGSGDLDVAVFDNAAGTGSPVGSAFTESDFEVIDIASASRPGTWLLEIEGYEGDEGAYELIVDSTNPCVDDGRNNANAASASTIAKAGDPIGALVACCSPDWFAMDLAAGDQISFAASVVSGGSVGVKLFLSDGTTQVTSAPPSTGDAIITYTALGSTRYLFQVAGTAKTTYNLTWSVTSTSGCTTLSCPSNRVCDSSLGSCVSDYCDGDDLCPGGYSCKETWCVNTCQSDNDCRSGYACKSFPDGDFCGFEGDGQQGASCIDHSECAGALTCSAEKKCQPQ